MRVADFFTKYVFGFMSADISREISLARDENRGGGNVLAALGLLCYTEQLGAVLRQNTCLKGNPNVGAFDNSEPRKNFEAFFREMGPAYAALLDRDELDVYRVFRCGMVHEYDSKRPCRVKMTDTDAAPCGIWRDGDEFVFVVERYFNDFCEVSRRLYDKLMAMPDEPMLPVRRRERRPRDPSAKCEGSAV